ncbi:MAG: hypothetical protein KH198_07790, partial [Oscillibacter sp.]|nr:hypothetical protein [Oscillibacter sp.]
QAFSVAHLHVLPSGALFVHCLIYKIHAPLIRGTDLLYCGSSVLSRTFFNFFEAFQDPQRRVTHSFDRIPDLVGNVNPFFKKT